VQVLPPDIRFTASDPFSAATPTFLAATSGNWSVQAGRYLGAALAGQPFALSGVDTSVAMNSMLRVDATVRTGALGGVVFDMYSPTDFKWAAISVATNQVLIGHYTLRSGWVVDAAASMTLSATTDYALSVTLKGPTASVSVDGRTMASVVFNSTAVDGAIGVLSRGGTASFDRFGFATDDPSFTMPAGATATTTATGSAKMTASGSIKLAPSAQKGASGRAEAPRIDWAAASVAVKPSVVGAKQRAETGWQGDFLLNLGKNAGRNPNSDIRVLL
jgi:hypothetical protein